LSAVVQSSSAPALASPGDGDARALKHEGSVCEIAQVGGVGPGDSFALVSPEQGRCAWCDGRKADRWRDRDFCGRKCRQAAFRLRQLWLGYRAEPPDPAGPPLRVCIADPPYPGKAARYYRNEPTYAGEVDYDGYALATSAEACRWLWPLCSDEVRQATWSKPIGTPEATLGMHNLHEVVLVKQARRLRGGIPDALVAQPARFGGHLPGRKPLAWIAWVFRMLGMQPGDQLVDLFPGTGVIGRSWRGGSAARRTPCTCGRRGLACRSALRPGGST
jgi:hypothetical protein